MTSTGWRVPIERNRNARSIHERLDHSFFSDGTHKVTVPPTVSTCVPN